MGQPLKSFRDSAIRLGVYDHDSFDSSDLDSLGPLAKPGRQPVGK